MLMGDLVVIAIQRDVTCEDGRRRRWWWGWGGVVRLIPTIIKLFELKKKKSSVMIEIDDIIGSIVIEINDIILIMSY